MNPTTTNGRDVWLAELGFVREAIAGIKERCAGLTYDQVRADGLEDWLVELYRSQDRIANILVRRYGWTGDDE